MVNVTNRVPYLLEDFTGTLLNGCFYEMELFKTRVSLVYLVEKILERKSTSLNLLVECLGSPKE